MIVAAASELPAGWQVTSLPALPSPSRVLLCPPDYYDVVDVKNEFMRGNIGSVDRKLAHLQWQTLRDILERNGVNTEILPAVPGCEDMVFTANPSFTGRRKGGEVVCVPSRMAFPSRFREVEAHRDWFEAQGYTIEELPANISRFEGTGDAIWHPGRALIWAGFGPRTERAAHDALAALFDVPLATLELAHPRFYHLDTCFCPVDERTVLIYPNAFTPAGLELIGRVFDDVIDVGEAEAAQNFACNAAAFHGRVVLIQSGAENTVSKLEQRGFIVVEVQTGEFLKSGGSVFCMKAAIY